MRSFLHLWLVSHLQGTTARDLKKQIRCHPIGRCIIRAGGEKSTREQRKWSDRDGDAD